MTSADSAVGSILDLQLNPKTLVKLLVGLFIVLTLFYLAKKGADAAIPRISGALSKAKTAATGAMAAPAASAPTDPMSAGL